MLNIFYWILTSAQFTKCSWVPWPIPQPESSHPQLFPPRYHHWRTQRLQVKPLGNFNWILNFCRPYFVILYFVPPSTWNKKVWRRVKNIIILLKTDLLHRDPRMKCWFLLSTSKAETKTWKFWGQIFSRLFIWKVNNICINNCVKD